jgi:hypothetical protein
MIAASDAPVVTFPDDYDEQSEFETPSRGYLSDVVVRLGDGSCYRLYFIDPIRLQQNLADEAQAGRAYFGEPNLVVLPEVTTPTIREAVQGLCRAGYFQHLKPLAQSSASVSGPASSI